MFRLEKVHKVMNSLCLKLLHEQSIRNQLQCYNMCILKQEQGQAGSLFLHLSEEQAFISRFLHEHIHPPTTVLLAFLGTYIFFLHFFQKDSINYQKIMLKRSIWTLAKVETQSLEANYNSPVFRMTWRSHF